MNIRDQVELLGDGPLSEESIRARIYPLFSRVLAGCEARGQIYLANHSLGRPLDKTADDILDAVSLWYSELDGAWGGSGWPAAMNAFRKGVAQLIGHPEPSCIAPKTAAGQGLRAVLNALPVDESLRPVNVVATRGEFDSIDFILKTYHFKGRANVQWVEPATVEPIPHFDSADIIRAINDSTDLVVVSHVLFTTGQLMSGLDQIVEAAHSHGALVLIDAYHSVGVVPLNFSSLNCDFMIGGSYKYTRGGPGACWLAVHPRHVETGLRTLDTGWFAKRNQFSYERPDEPLLALDGDSWLESTPPVLTFYQALAGLEFTHLIRVDRLRAYNLCQQAFLREQFLEKGVPFVDQNLEHRGSFTLVPSSDAHGLSDALKAMGVTTDARGTTVRFGPDVLTTFEELESAALKTAKVLNHGD